MDFIVVEGVDGVGKTTYIRDILLPIYPDAAIIKAIKNNQKGLLDYTKPLAPQFIEFILENTKEALKSNPETIIMDRWFLSTLGYQIAEVLQSPESQSKIQEIEDLVFNNAMKEFFTILTDEYDEVNLLLNYINANIVLIHRLVAPKLKKRKSFYKVDENDLLLPKLETVNNIMHDLVSSQDFMNIMNTYEIEFGDKLKIGIPKFLNQEDVLLFNIEKLTPDLAIYLLIHYVYRPGLRENPVVRSLLSVIKAKKEFYEAAKVFMNIADGVSGELMKLHEPV